MRANTLSLISVVMAVHNGAHHLAAALSSVLSQTYEALEVIVIDDGSTDTTATYLARCGDPRLRVVTNESSQGLARSLNRGLDMAAGQYIVRMDADDVCHPRRVERQLEFMEARPEIGLLGTACRMIDDSGTTLGIVRYPTNDAAMRWKLLFASPVAHPSVMIRAEVLRQHALRYDPAWPLAQDYELWPRLLRHCRGANLREVLLDYRLHDDSATVTKRDAQDHWALRVCEREVGPFLPPGMSRSLLASLRRSVVGGMRADDPPVGYLRGQLLLLAKNYMRLMQLERKERKDVKRAVVATVLADGALFRHFNRHSLAPLLRASLLAPCTAACASGRMARNVCARWLKTGAARLSKSRS